MKLTMEVIVYYYIRRGKISMFLVTEVASYVHRRGEKKVSV